MQEAQDPNRQQNIADAVAELPKLATVRSTVSPSNAPSVSPETRPDTQTHISFSTLTARPLSYLRQGLDVNVHFTSGIRGFEFTAETAIFDLLRIPLVHGWLADPADAVTLSVVDGLSYNQLAEQLISQKLDAGRENVAQARDARFPRSDVNAAPAVTCSYKSPVLRRRDPILLRDVLQMTCAAVLRRDV